jgi:hypothetical protein
MNLYHWAAAGCLKEYSCGDIIVMAESIDQAREKAKAHMNDFLKEHRSWWWDYAIEDKVDENYLDDYNEFKLKLLADLIAEPDLIEPAVIFIRGSE